MKKIKGIALEVSHKYITLLTAEGDYHKVQHPGGSVKPGDEISASLFKPILPVAYGLTASLAVAALILIFFFPSIIFNNDHLFPDGEDLTYGYLVLDINPSLEIGFNEDLEVTYLKPLNNDAALLLEGVEAGQNIFEVIDLLLGRSINLGFLTPGDLENLIMITVVQVDQSGFTPQNLADLIEEKLTQARIPYIMGIFEADEKALEKAQNAGISLNQYLLEEALEKLGEGNMSDRGHPLPELFIKFKDKLPFSEYRTTVVPELPPQVPFNAEDLPGPPDLPADIPVSPGQGNNGSDNRSDLPALPIPAEPGSGNKPGIPASLP